jgi:hypothetical protein
VVFAPFGFVVWALEKQKAGFGPIWPRGTVMLVERRGQFLSLSHPLMILHKSENPALFHFYFCFLLFHFWFLLFCFSSSFFKSRSHFLLLLMIINALILREEIYIAPLPHPRARERKPPGWSARSCVRAVPRARRAAKKLENGAAENELAREQKRQSQKVFPA